MTEKYDDSVLYQPMTEADGEAGRFVVELRKRLDSKDVVEGPWEQSILDPTRVVLRGDNGAVYKVYLFASKDVARVVRNALNHEDRLKGEKNGREE